MKSSSGNHNPRLNSETCLKSDALFLCISKSYPLVRSCAATKRQNKSFVQWEVKSCQSTVVANKKKQKQWEEIREKINARNLDVKRTVQEVVKNTKILLSVWLKWRQRAPATRWITLLTEDLWMWKTSLTTDWKLPVAKKRSTTSNYNTAGSEWLHWVTGSMSHSNLLAIS